MVYCSKHIKSYVNIMWPHDVNHISARTQKILAVVGFSYARLYYSFSHAQLVDVKGSTSMFVFVHVVLVFYCIGFGMSLL